MRAFLLFLVASVLLSSCEEKDQSLPILGRHDFDTEYKNGELVTDTIYYTLPDFRFTDHNGNIFDEQLVKDKIYVTDFFFTSCPTICPKMSKNMLQMAEEFKDNERVLFLSHSIDTRHDSVPVLKKYATKLNAPNNWYFVTGEKDKIFSLAEKYMVSAGEDPHAPGGVIHSGAFVLLDGKRRIRAYYDGTKSKEMNKLRADIKTLIKESS
ncbi:MAG: SCO family protein [Crocinitomicaceae bacterium]|nr:SCO family protein [Crocinitomicaceae bacterium]|tara:strand:+ start:2438 stop:3067 length:630 start_codon:yes stop_codon:yes gene_type:complete